MTPSEIIQEAYDLGMYANTPYLSALCNLKSHNHLNDATAESNKIKESWQSKKANLLNTLFAYIELAKSEVDLEASQDAQAWADQWEAHAFIQRRKARENFEDLNKKKIIAPVAPTEKLET